MRLALDNAVGVPTLKMVGAFIFACGALGWPLLYMRSQRSYLRLYARYHPGVAPLDDEQWYRLWWKFDVRRIWLLSVGPIAAAMFRKQAESHLERRRRRVIAVLIGGFAWLVAGFFVFAN